MSVVVITGCSSGFGMHAALAFARRGDSVYATMRNLARDGALRSALEAEGLAAEVVELDVEDDASVRAGVERVLEDGGRIDVLVNNAGVGGALGPIEVLTDEQWLAVLNPNLLGAIRMTRAVLPGMRAQGSGAIVNISSLAGRLPGTPMSAAYAASKHALCSFSDSLWSEVEDFGLSVTCIEPGFFATNVVDNSATLDIGDSPYAAISKAMENFYRTSMDNAPPPDAVVDAIVAAADGRRGDSIHQPVGADAEAFISGLGTMTYDEYHAMGRQMLGF